MAVTIDIRVQFSDRFGRNPENQVGRNLYSCAVYTYICIELTGNLFNPYDSFDFLMSPLLVSLLRKLAVCIRFLLENVPFKCAF